MKLKTGPKAGCLGTPPVSREFLQLWAGSTFTERDAVVKRLPSPQ